jgi:hypothetical protein
LFIVQATGHPENTSADYLLDVCGFRLNYLSVVSMTEEEEEEVKKLL